MAKWQRLTRGHHAALPFTDVPGFVEALKTRTGVAARALEFLILTAGRSGKVIVARWPGLDKTRKVWTVPASRMKAGTEHRVPLTDRTLAILAEMETIRRGEFVFPTFRAATPMSNMVFDALLKRMKVRATAHGFRSSMCQDLARGCGCGPVSAASQVEAYSRSAVEFWDRHAGGEGIG